MIYHTMEDIVYSICEADIQYEAERSLGRKLTEEEMLEAVDALSDGIGESIGIIYSTIFTEILPARMGDCVP
ncbi:MAG: hypothetical protein LBI05_10505 [Planctomycetaceae bacterium]|jgi:hypothetical protein|nr:hypothetical protein [Planctomycetaceae bacterium]